MRTPSKDRAGKKAHAQWKQQVVRRKTRIGAALRQGGGEMKMRLALYAETKIEELAKRKLRFDHPELAQPENE